MDIFILRGTKEDPNPATANTVTPCPASMACDGIIWAPKSLASLSLQAATYSTRSLSWGVSVHAFSFHWQVFYDPGIFYVHGLKCNLESIFTTSYHDF